MEFREYTTKCTYRYTGDELPEKLELVWRVLCYIVLGPVYSCGTVAALFHTCSNMPFKPPVRAIRTVMDLNQFKQSEVRTRKLFSLRGFAMLKLPTSVAVSYIAVDHLVLLVDLRRAAGIP